MRLLNIHSKSFQTFLGDDIPPYIATSHRWSNGETTYQNVKDGRNTDSSGYKKVEKFCAIARKQSEYLTPSSDGRCDWIWIDTCCIDQTSSAEVTEAINSMFSWYKRAHHCIAYLADVRPPSMGMGTTMHDFHRSEWFERGWTLQELLAPRCVIFVAQNWEMIGHKCSSEANSQSCSGCRIPNSPVLNDKLAEITGVPEDVLWNYECSKQLRPKAKWSWSARRKTTRPEDAAYCLLGIFDVYMPLIYGEGAYHASVRLRQEIMKRNRNRRTKTDPWSNLSQKPCQTRTNSFASDVFDASDAVFEHGGVGNAPNVAKKAIAGKHLMHVDQAALARLDQAQIAAAGDFLPQLNLAELSNVSSAQISVAGDTLPYWDLKVLSNTPPGQIATIVAAGGMTKTGRRTKGR